MKTISFSDTGTTKIVEGFFLGKCKLPWYTDPSYRSPPNVFLTVINLRKDDPFQQRKRKGGGVGGKEGEKVKDRGTLFSVSLSEEASREEVLQLVITSGKILLTLFGVPRFSFSFPLSFVSLVSRFFDLLLTSYARVYFFLVPTGPQPPNLKRPRSSISFFGASGRKPRPRSLYGHGLNVGRDCLLFSTPPFLWTLTLFCL